MSTKWVIYVWQKGSKRYYCPRNHDTTSDPLVRDWMESTPYFAEKYDSEEEAEMAIYSGREKNWGGVFGVEKIFIIK